MQNIACNSAIHLYKYSFRSLLDLLNYYKLLIDVPK